VRASSCSRSRVSRSSGSRFGVASSNGHDRICLIVREDHAPVRSFELSTNARSRSLGPSPEAPRLQAYARIRGETKAPRVALEEEDGHALIVTLLLQSRSPAVIQAAQTLYNAIERGDKPVLSEAERDAILGVLEESPERLARLRGALLVERSQRGD
jgi:hypothetical protein